MLLTYCLSGCGYNTMVTMHENIDAAWAQVENQLQRRNDLIPNLVEVTKGYATHEKEIFDHIADARSRLIDAGSRDAEDRRRQRSRLGAVAPAGARRALSGPQGQSAVRPPLRRAGGDREPHRHRAPPLQRGGARLQHLHQEDARRTSRRACSASPSRSTSKRRRRRSRCRRCSSERGALRPLPVRLRLTCARGRSGDVSGAARRLERREGLSSGGAAFRCGQTRVPMLENRRMLHVWMVADRCGSRCDCSRCGCGGGGGGSTTPRRRRRRPNTRLLRAGEWQRHELRR